MRKDNPLRALVTGANVCGWAIVCAYSIHASVPHNPIHLPLESSIDARTWAPQGWAFFTRDAHEEELDILFADQQGTWRPAGDGPNASASNWFGASRRGRARSNEAGTLLQSVPHGAWKDCGTDINECASLAPVIHVLNPLAEPTLCGSVAFSMQRPVPWAWAHGPKEVRMPVRIARVEVTC